MNHPTTRSAVPGPRTGTEHQSRDPAGLTTFPAASARWTATGADHTPAPATQDAPPGPRLLDLDQDLPLPPTALPPLEALREITQAAADRARQLLHGDTPHPSATAHAVHIAATRPGTGPDPAYRLNIDIGHWRDLHTVHRDHGCQALDTLTTSPDTS